MPVTIFFESFFCWASARPPQSPDPNRSRLAGSSLQNAVHQGQQGLGRGWGLGLGVGVDAALIPALSSSSVPAVSGLLPPGPND